MNAKKILSLFILFFSLVALYFINQYGPFYRLLYASIGLIWLIKVSSLFFAPSKFESRLGFFLYLFAWPGISTSGFLKRQNSINEKASERFFENWITFIFGVFLLLFSVFMGKGESVYFNYLSLFSILLIFHLGLIEVIRSLIRLLRFEPNNLFNRPFNAVSLRDFWSNRWNKAFVEMDTIFILKPLKGKLPNELLIFFIFLISGILHEIGISYAAGISYGGPFLYFFIQGLCFVLEKKIKFGRIGTLFVVLAPFPILFPPEFTNLFLGGLAKRILLYSAELNNDSFIFFLLKLGSFLQLLVLTASVQVPKKLNWSEEFKRLSPFNSKIFWTYGGYIFFIIIFLSITSLSLSFEESRSTSFTLWIIFTNLFWMARVFIDVFHYSHEDWPKGAEFIIGHICVTTLFVTIVLVYTAILFSIYKGTSF